MAARATAGSQTWLWSLRKSDVIEELKKYNVSVESRATLSELRILLRAQLNKSKVANAGREGIYDKLLSDLDRSEIELDDTEEGIESEEEQRTLDDDQSHGDAQAKATREQETREAELRRQVEGEVREEMEKQERERLEREERERRRVEREKRELEELRAREQEVREREAREQREREELEAREREMRVQEEQERRGREERAERERMMRETREREEQELRERLRREIREQIRQEIDARRVQEVRERPAPEQEEQERRERELREERERREHEQREREDREIRERLRREITEQIRREIELERQANQAVVNPGPIYPAAVPRETDEFRSRDVVRKWGVTFNGERDVLDFIERIDELTESYGFQKDKLVHCIPMLLRDKAIHWYRNNKRDWISWEDFTSDLKSFFLPPGREIELEEQIRNRVQRETEIAKEYATSLQTLMRRHGQMTSQAKLARLYQNLRPEYRRYIKRTEFTNVPELLQLAGEFEQLVVQESGQSPSSSKPAAGKTNTGKSATGKTTKPGAALEIFEYDWREHCWRCRQKGHRQPQCTNPRVKFCSRCGKMGTWTRDCCPWQGNAARVDTSSQSRPGDRQDLRTSGAETQTNKRGNTVTTAASEPGSSTTPRQ
ncbi:trichohyalin-like [Microplitis mediator]|uniref:trichohyalin-like n=1 Tax=Microplitis mediator TaxID=375433 RepID=UPI002557C539|nr:trichohyalin-like [Microplitis mediator]